MDDTRDIAIQTRADLSHISAQVQKLTELVASLKQDLHERQGAEKMARAIHTLIGGATGAAIVKGLSWLVNVPIK